MAEIVAAAIMSHAPMITGKPNIGQPVQRDRLYSGFKLLSQNFSKARPDIIVAFVNDHMQSFQYNNIPTFCISLAAEYYAPSPGRDAELMKLSPRKVHGHTDWGMGLLEYGLANQFDFAYSYDIQPGDELSVPLHFLLAQSDNTPVIPIYINCGAPPLPTMRRCYQMGQLVNAFIKTRPATERIGLLATGGISHWVGTPETGRINEKFDQYILDHIFQANIEPLLRLSTADIDHAGGNGAQELRNWMGLLGAVPKDWKAEVLAYEPVTEWITGCTAIEVKP